MYVMQIKNIRLKHQTETRLSFYAYERTQEWLKRWTPITNFEAVIADTRDEALYQCKLDLRAKLVPSWLSEEQKICYSMFEFEVSYQEIKNNRFWMNADMIWCKWHSID